MQLNQSLFSLSNRTSPCGSILYRYWPELGNEAAQAARFNTYEHLDRGTSALSGPLPTGKVIFFASQLILNINYKY